MSDKKVRYPCNCSNEDPEHTIERGEDGWTRYVCSNCGAVKFKLVGQSADDPEGF